MLGLILAAFFPKNAALVTDSLTGERRCQPTIGNYLETTSTPQQNLGQILKKKGWRVSSPLENLCAHN